MVVDPALEAYPSQVFLDMRASPNARTVAKWVKWGPVSPKKGGKGGGKGRNSKAPPKSKQLSSEMFGPHPKHGASVVVPDSDDDCPDLDDSWRFS